MGGHRISHHLEALGRVVDAAAASALEVAVPWGALQQLRVLLGADLVVLEGVDRGRARSYFSQVLAPDLQVFTTSVDAGSADRFWRIVQRAAQSHQPATAVAQGHVQRADPSEPPGAGVHGQLSHLVLGRRCPSLLLAGVPDGVGRELRLLCLRDGRRAFDERDDLDVRLLLPHLERAYRRGDQGPRPAA